jgi:hypothetical protein
VANEVLEEIVYGNTIDLTLETHSEEYALDLVT